jgi:hypothetical protein
MIPIIDRIVRHPHRIDNRDEFEPNLDSFTQDETLGITASTL